MTITEKVAYLKGLFEGLKIDKESDTGKLFSAVIDVLDDIAMEVTDTTERVDAIDADLADVEDLLYEDLDDYDNLFCDGDCDNCDEDCDEKDFEMDDEGMYAFECPNCHETVYFDDSIFDDDDEDFELECPACGAKLDSVFEMEDDEDDE